MLAAKEPARAPYLSWARIMARRRAAVTSNSGKRLSRNRLTVERLQRFGDPNVLTVAPLVGLELLTLDRIELRTGDR